MRKTAFTLIELLVVVAIVALLSVLAIPAIMNVTTGSALTRGGQMVGDQLALARQEATTKNRDVQVRFIWKEGTPAGWRGVQLWAASPTDVTQYHPLSRVAWLPEGTLISDVTTLSPLMTSPTIPQTNAVFPGLGNTKYCGFRFRADGSTDMSFNSTANFVTVLQIKDAAVSTAPANYALIQVDPVNGRTRTYRP